MDTTTTTATTTTTTTTTTNNNKKRGDTRERGIGEKKAPLYLRGMVCVCVWGGGGHWGEEGGGGGDNLQRTTQGRNTHSNTRKAETDCVLDASLNS